MPAAIVAAKADPSQKRRAFRPGQDHTATETGSILRVFPTGGKRWVWRGTVQGRRRDFDLGSYPTVSLKGARTKASPPCCSASMAGELPKQVGAVSPPGCLRSRRRRRPPRATRRMALTRMVDDSGECLRVVATELEVGHAKVLRAMGATIRYLSHKGLCERSLDPRNSGHRIDGF